MEAGTWESVGWLKERGQYALQGRIPQQEEAPPALPRGTGTMGRGRIGTALTGSPLLPCTPGGPSTTTVSPCTPKAEREVGVKGTRAAACLPIAPSPKDSPYLLWVLGPQGLPMRKVRCCKDAQQGAHSTSLGTPVSGGVSFPPPAPQPTEALTLSPRSPRFPGKPCGGEERCGRKGAWIRVQLWKGVLTAGPRSPSGPGRPSSPCKEGM